MAFTFREQFDILHCYFDSGRQAAPTRRMYRNLYPDRRIPAANTIDNWINNLQEYGSYRNPRRDNGRPRAQGDIEDRLLDVVRDNPNISCRRAAAMLDTNHMKVNIYICSLFFKKFENY